MSGISCTDPIAVELVAAIRTGDVTALRRLLSADPGLATAGIVDDKGVVRTLLLIASDWPGHYPNGAAVVSLLAAAGADVNARLIGPHEETPLHWAASTDDVTVLDALLDAGADIEAMGSVLGGGTALKNATGFKQWNVANRLVERGADVDLASAAALGLIERLEAHFGAAEKPDQEQISLALWYACHGGSVAAARFLAERGGEVNWMAPWDGSTPLDAALADGATELAEWLRTKGAHSATER